MDKDKQNKSVYPEASRGVLANQQIHKSYQGGPINKVRDYSPATLIAMTAIAAVLFLVIGVGTYIFVFQRVHKIDPSVAAFKIAKKFAELKTSQSSSELEAITEEAVRRCPKGEGPIITITHEYSDPNQPRRTDNTVIDTSNIKDLIPILDELVQKSDGAKRNTLDISC